MESSKLGIVSNVLLLGKWRLNNMNPKMTKKIIVTGCAGFIGFHIARRLLNEGVSIVGIDNVNNYYCQDLKRDRLKLLCESKDFLFHELDIAQKDRIDEIVGDHKPAAVIHMAAQAGVRWSLSNPWAYLESNLTGFLSVLEACRHAGVPHLIYASSSSVYGSNSKVPFSVADRADHPISLYAATKKSNELMAHSYSHLYGFSTTGLRFFTVYGPWGRPDMAIWKFAEAICRGQAIDLYNNGDMRRDFTFIDDVVEAVVRLARVSQCDGSSPALEVSLKLPSCEVFNVGNRQPVCLEQVVTTIERAVGARAIRRYLPMQPGDVQTTCAETTATEEAIGFRPDTSLESGISRFVQWFLDYRAKKMPSERSVVAA